MKDFLKSMGMGLIGIFLIGFLSGPNTIIDLIAILWKPAVAIVAVIAIVAIISKIRAHKKAKIREQRYREYLANRSDTDRIVDAINDLKWRIR